MKRKNYYLFILLVLYISINSCSKVDKDYNSELFESSTSQVENNNDALFKINNEEAKIFACNFMNDKNRKFKSTYEVKSINDFNVSFANRKLTVVNLSPNGFVLMANDTRHIPVYAFSEEGEFTFNSIEQLYPGQKEWILETFLLNLELEKDSLAQEENGVRKMWYSYLNKEDNLKIIGDDDCIETYLEHVVNIYDDCVLTTLWHQDLPYSLSTPICNQTGNHKLTGCVATAMAQVMKYWEYPNNISWSILQNSYPINSTTTSAYEVAGLMVDIGLAVNMNWGCNASSASSIAAKNAFKNDFGYNNSITYDDYHIDDIMQNLQWGYPVLLGGYRTRINLGWTYIYLNGHQWITDGLREEYNLYEVDCLIGCCTHDISYIGKNHTYYLHMNWGWGHSTQNVWYYSNNLTHPINSSYDYKWNKDMIINIHP